MSLKSESAEVYVASTINDAIGNGYDPKDTKKKIIKIFSQILKRTGNIQRALFHKPQEDKEVAHYTSLDTLKNLVNQERFRLYNSAYMNDPKEGHVFFEIINERVKKQEGSEYDVEKRFYEKGNDISSRSPAYIGSFTPVDPEKPKENLLLWLAYGKQGKEEAAGSCLIFPQKGFAKDHRLTIGYMRTASTNTDLEEQNSQPLIYNVAYIDAANSEEFSGIDKEVADKIIEDLKELEPYLGNVEGAIENIPDDTKDKLKQGKLKQLVRELLDSIRFLFKTSHYEGEREFRVLELRYPQEKTGESDEIKVDAGQTPPRFYLETPESFRFSEVILGPRAQNFENWKWWIKDQHLKQGTKTKVRKSKIPYSNENT